MKSQGHIPDVFSTSNVGKEVVEKILNESLAKIADQLNQIKQELAGLAILASKYGLDMGQDPEIIQAFKPKKNEQI